MHLIFSLPFLTGVILLTDFYIWSGIKALIPPTQKRTRRLIKLLFWGFTAFVLISLLVFRFLPNDSLPKNPRLWLTALVGIPLISKLLTALFLMIDDVGRGSKWLKSKVVKAERPGSVRQGNVIPRSEFLTKASMITGGGLAGTFVFGILSGAHDYRIHRVRIPLKNLPRELDGIRIAQLSDIHCGSFFNKTAVKGGVEMLLREKPDLAFFTGDLVNDRAREANEYVPIFGKVTAPLGVYSVLGNHDYGDYYRWPSAEAKARNLAALQKAHQAMGWDLLNDEHRSIRVDNASIAIVGVQNWGGGRFPKYGNLDKALINTGEFPVKLLLSHDPSHWDLQVSPRYPDVDVMFAGHTHGMQFGVEIPGFRWSPAQFNYKHWAGLYQEKDQYLYVNRGFGYLGYPGRVGILPEITILELVKA